MHSTERAGSGSFNLKTLSAAVVSALLFSNAYAAGLGKLTVLSSLGQPLRAEIELTSVSKDEAGTLVAKLASPDTFRQANVDYTATLSSLRFSVEQRGERQYIHVTSAQPLNEPFVDMLLELTGPNGRLVREYTFLLDPADLRSTQSAQVAPNVAPQPGSARAAQPNPSAAPLPQSERPTGPRQSAAAKITQSTASESTNDASAEYRVRSGDTLGRIAGQMKASGVSLDQMLVALYRANPDAFIGNNMNRLRAGQILSVPDAKAARSISTAEAKSVVLAQSADFNNYRNKLAGQVAAATAQKTAESKQSAAGKITAKVEEPSTPDGESKDKLKLAKPNPLPGTASSKNNAAATNTEDKIANDKAAAEANARVKELEKNVNDLQKMLEVKKKGMAEQQNQADVAKGDAKPAAAEPPAAAASAVPAAPIVNTGDKPAESNADKAAAPTAPAASEPPVAAAKPKPVAPPPPPAPEPGFFDELMDNPLTLPGAGVLLAALGALGIYSARRRKQPKHFEDSIITDSSLKANSLFGSTGGQSVDTNNSVFNSNFAPSVSQLDSNEVDPVAEADVYIAYGRDAQAEEILKEALRTQPDRNAVRVKLLEIYSNRKDLRAFEVLATELYGLSKGDGDEWVQAALMGIALDPNNPLYASGKSSRTLDASAGGLTAPPVSAERADSALESIEALGEDTAYFSNTALDMDSPLDQQGLQSKDELPSDASTAEPIPADDKATRNDLDFDLGDMNLQSMEVPNTIPRPEPSVPNAEMASIDFDFLDKPDGSADSVPSVPAIEDSLPLGDNALPEISLNHAAEEVAPLDFDLPSLPASPAADAPKGESKVGDDPLDFDLSEISLELGPDASDAKAASVRDTDEAPASIGDSFSASDAEMATKLDLAVAYQEIGDKEGARELLDEVLKGGTPEQSQKAKSLLLELA
ncbi:FimV/HubP family polar landmark protein [Noviherbaspirillum cavernae]|nr:FimV/HubP family polar landmark protein [Noviherbaspirillum cavernae]